MCCFVFCLLCCLYPDYGLFTIEVKNWSGKVTLGSDGKSWIHRKCSYSDKDTSVSYDEKNDDLIANLKLKTQLLRNHLLRNGVCLTDKFFHPRIVFMNMKIELDDVLASKLEVISSLRYKAFLQSFEKGFGWSMASAIVPSFLTGKTSRLLVTMIEICEEYASEMDLLFKPKKVKITML